MLGGDRRISEPSAVCISITLPMYDPQKPTIPFTQNCRLSSQKSCYAPLALTRTHWISWWFFTNPFEKIRASQSNWIIFPQKNTCWNNTQIKPPPESMVEFGSSWWLYCPRNLPMKRHVFLQRNRSHRFPRQPPQASASQSMKQGIGTSINSIKSKAEVRESNSKPQKQPLLVGGWTNPPEKICASQNGVVLPKKIANKNVETKDILQGTIRFLGITLPETNIAPANRPSQKETSIPTIHF